ncbi:maturase, partial [Frankia sp. Cpl3]|nr:maturase [Frankia sp. Cpl3]
MIAALAEKIQDGRFLRLVQNMLKAGYLEDWIYHATLSGVPQGGSVSPILSNIYLNRLDVFVETVLVPAFTRGARRARSPVYLREAAALARARRRGDPAEVRRVRQRMRNLP